MANDYDFQWLMSSFSGMFFGSIIGAIVGVLAYFILDLLNIGDVTVKLAIVLLCIIVGAVYFAIYGVKKHPK